MLVYNGATNQPKKSSSRHGNTWNQPSTSFLSIQMFLTRNSFLNRKEVEEENTVPSWDEICIRETLAAKFGAPAGWRGPSGGDPLKKGRQRHTTKWNTQNDDKVSRKKCKKKKKKKDCGFMNEPTRSVVSAHRKTTATRRAGMSHHRPVNYPAHTHTQKDQREWLTSRFFFLRVPSVEAPQRLDLGPTCGEVYFRPNILIHIVTHTRTHTTSLTSQFLQDDSSCGWEDNSTHTHTTKNVSFSFTFWMSGELSSGYHTQVLFCICGVIGFSSLKSSSS